MTLLIETVEKEIQDGRHFHGVNVLKFANSDFLELLFDDTTYLRKSKKFINFSEIHTIGMHFLTYA